MASRCSKCGSEERVKAGKKGDRQRWKCKSCGCHYSVEWRGRYSREIREIAIRMVSDGSSFRQVERALGVSNVTVMKWVRAYGETLIKAGKDFLNKDSKKELEIVEIDELCTFVGKKKTMHGCGYVLIELQEKSLVTGSVVALSEH